MRHHVNTAYSHRAYSHEILTIFMTGCILPGEVNATRSEYMLNAAYYEYDVLYVQREQCAASDASIRGGSESDEDDDYNVGAWDSD